MRSTRTNDFPGVAAIASLYAVEAEIRGHSAAERRAARQEKSRQTVAALEPWLRSKLELISQKSSWPRQSAMLSRAGRD